MCNSGKGNNSEVQRTRIFSLEKATTKESGELRLKVPKGTWRIPSLTCAQAEATRSKVTWPASPMLVWGLGVWTSVSKIPIENLQELSPSHLEEKFILTTHTNFPSGSVATVGASFQCTFCWENSWAHIGHKKGIPYLCLTPEVPFTGASQSLYWQSSWYRKHYTCSEEATPPDLSHKLKVRCTGIFLTKHNTLTDSLSPTEWQVSLWHHVLFFSHTRATINNVSEMYVY